VPRESTRPTPARVVGDVVSSVLRWYEANGRDLPWRRPEATPWQIVVSEFMLQQTPVARVLRPWQDWVERWPTPAALAVAPVGDAVRAWGRLGYPRRAVRLHATATTITERHDGEVPSDYDSLLALPGIGSYSAAAIASFAFGQRHLVLDTNVRRVLHRIDRAEAHPPPSVTLAERQLAERFLPPDPALASRWAVASMELGALVCTARSPRCPDCPVADHCGWRRSGRPAATSRPRRAQSYAGTDRACRGALLAVLRAAEGPVTTSELDLAWSDPRQRQRCLDSLTTDGLISAAGSEQYALPG
jgi:A/G-specific adenine glycosylase